MPRRVADPRPAQIEPFGVGVLDPRELALSPGAMVVLGLSVDSPERSDPPKSKTTEVALGSHSKSCVCCAPKNPADPGPEGGVLSLVISETKDKKRKLAITLAVGDEGCPCCFIIDLDELTAVIAEMIAHSQMNQATKNQYNILIGKLADLSSSTHWGISMISGLFAIVGVTTGWRNMMGTGKNLQKILQVRSQLEEEIAERKNSSDEDKLIIKRLQAYKNSLDYSVFDSRVNFVGPGLLNFIASSAILSNAVWKSSFSLIFISLYAGLQASKNLYDLVRNWNSIIAEKPADDSRFLNYGIIANNQITIAKRKFYTVNSLGFLLFTYGAIQVLSALVNDQQSASNEGVEQNNDSFISGITALTLAAVATAFTNNIWLRDFVPRNGPLGIDRKELDDIKTLQEIGKNTQLIEVTQDYKKEHLSFSYYDISCLIYYSVITSLPFLNDRGSLAIHNLKQAKLENVVNQRGKV